jgi:acetyl-CoA acyltransferase 2
VSSVQAHCNESVTPVLLADTGSSILANLTHNLHRLDKQWALGAACIGGGQGIAVVLERC